MTTPASRIRRRKYGRNWGYKIDGEKAPGVTGITRMMPISKGLRDWPAKATARYAINNWAALNKLPNGDRYDRLMSARWDESGEAKMRGTQVHRFGERMMNGEDVPDEEISDELRPYVEQYVDFLERAEPVIVAVELCVAHLSLRYCGTLDIIADLRALRCAGDKIPAGRWLLDVKTGATGVWPETALQTCGYANAELYVHPETGDEVPMSVLGINYCGALNIRADGWDLYPVDAGDDVWDYFQRLVYLKHHEDTPREWTGEAIDPLPKITATARDGT